MFLKTTNTAVSSARDRYISNRMMNSSSKLEKQFSEGPVSFKKGDSTTESISKRLLEQFILIIIPKLF